MRKSAVAVVALLVAGCGQPGQEAVPAGHPPSFTPPPTIAPSPSPTPSQPMPSAYGPLPPDCSQHDGVLAHFGQIEAATGDRYMQVSLLNCSDDVVDVGAPTIGGFDAAGETIELTIEHKGLPLKLGYEDVGFVHLYWASNGRCERGVQELRVTVAGEDLSYVEGCFQLGGSFAPEFDADVVARLSISPAP